MWGRVFLFSLFLFVLAQGETKPKLLIQTIPDNLEDVEKDSLLVATHFGFLVGLFEMCPEIEKGSTVLSKNESELFSFSRDHFFNCANISVQFRAENASWLHGNGNTIDERIEYMNKTHPNVLAVVLPVSDPFPPISPEHTFGSHEDLSRENYFAKTSYSNLNSFPFGVFSPAFPLPHTTLRTPLVSNFSPNILHIRSTVADDAAATANLIANYCNRCSISLLFEISPPVLQARQILRSVILSQNTRAISAEEGIRFNKNGTVRETRLMTPNFHVDVWSSDGIILLFSSPLHLSVALSRYIEKIRKTSLKTRAASVLVMSSVFKDMEDITAYEDIRRVLSSPEFTTCWETRRCHRVRLLYSNMVPDPRDDSLAIVRKFHESAKSLSISVILRTVDELNIPMEDIHATAMAWVHKLIGMTSRHSTAVFESYMTARVVTRSILRLAHHRYNVDPQKLIEQPFNYGIMILDGFRLGPFGSSCEQKGSGCKCNQGMRSVRYSRASVKKVNSTTDEISPFLATAGNDTHQLVVSSYPFLALHFAECGFSFSKRQREIVVGQICSLSGPDASHCKRSQIGLLASLAVINAEGGLHGSYLRLKFADEQGDSQIALQIAHKWLKNHSQVTEISTSPILAFSGIVNESTLTAVSSVSTKFGVPIIGPRRSPESPIMPLNPLHIFVRPSLQEEKDYIVDYLVDQKHLYRVALITSNDNLGVENTKALANALKRYNTPVYAIDYTNIHASLEEQVQKVLKSLQTAVEIHKMGPAQVIFLDLLSVELVSALLHPIWLKWPGTFFVVSSLIEPKDIVASLKQVVRSNDPHSILDHILTSQFLPYMHFSTLQPEIYENRIDSAGDLIAEYLASLSLLESQLMLKQVMRNNCPASTPPIISTPFDFPALDNIELTHQDFVLAFTSLESYVAGRLFIDSIKRVGPDYTAKKLVDTIYMSRVFSFGGSNGIVIGPYEYPSSQSREQCMQNVYAQLENINKGNEDISGYDQIDVHCGCNRGGNSISLYSLSNGEMTLLKSTFDASGRTNVYRRDRCGLKFHSLRQLCSSEHWHYSLGECDSSTLISWITFHWKNSHPWNSSLSMDCEGSSLPQSIASPCSRVPYDSSPGIVLIVIGVVGLITILLLALFVWKTRNTEVMKTMQSPFLLISLAGAGLGMAGIFPSIADYSPFMCSLNPILTSLGLMLIHVSLYVRIMRIYRLFKNVELQRMVLTDALLYRIIIKYMSAVCILLLLWVLTGGPSVDYDEILLSNGHKVTWKRCGNKKIGVWFYMIAILLLYIICKNCYLANKIRKMPSKFQDAKYVLVAIYTAALPMLLCAIMLSFLHEENVLVTHLGYGITAFVINVVAMLWLVVPKLQTAIQQLHKKVHKGSVLPEKSNAHEPERQSEHNSVAHRVELAQNTQHKLDEPTCDNCGIQDTMPVDMAGQLYPHCLPGIDSRHNKREKPHWDSNEVENFPSDRALVPGTGASGLSLPSPTHSGKPVTKTVQQARHFSSSLENQVYNKENTLQTDAPNPNPIGE